MPFFVCVKLFFSIFEMKIRIRDKGRRSLENCPLLSIIFFNYFHKKVDKIQQVIMPELIQFDYVDVELTVTIYILSN